MIGSCVECGRRLFDGEEFEPTGLGPMCAPLVLPETAQTAASTTARPLGEASASFAGRRPERAQGKGILSRRGADTASRPSVQTTQQGVEESRLSVVLQRGQSLSLPSKPGAPLSGSPERPGALARLYRRAQEAQARLNTRPLASGVHVGVAALRRPTL
jgi:hypothetical protein